MLRMMSGGRHMMARRLDGVIMPSCCHMQVGSLGRWQHKVHVLSQSAVWASQTRITRDSCTPLRFPSVAGITKPSQ
eukprot:4708286-Prymnesium_polylepis.2